MQTLRTRDVSRRSLEVEGPRRVCTGAAGCRGRVPGSPESKEQSGHCPRGARWGSTRFPWTGCSPGPTGETYIPLPYGSFSVSPREVLWCGVFLSKGGVLGVPAVREGKLKAGQGLSGESGPRTSSFRGPTRARGRLDRSGPSLVARRVECGRRLRAVSSSRRFGGVPHLTSSLPRLTGGGAQADFPSGLSVNPTRDQVFGAGRRA